VARLETGFAEDLFDLQEHLLGRVIRKPKLGYEGLRRRVELVAGGHRRRHRHADGAQHSRFRARRPTGFSISFACLFDASFIHRSPAVASLAFEIFDVAEVPV
jgi:hypothetical protein